MTLALDQHRPAGPDPRADLPARFPSLPGDPELVAAIRLAVGLAGAEHAAINLTDQSSVHQFGVDGVWTTSGWEQALCATTVLTGRTVSVADASCDPRFAGNPWVDGHRGQVRAYTSVPLVRDGQVIGTLCTAHRSPGSPDRRQVASLEDLASMVVSVLDRRWTLMEVAAAHAELVATHDDLAESQAFTEALLEALPVGVVAGDAQQRVRLFNRVSRLWHGHDTDAGLAPEELSDAYDLFEADGCTPLTTDRIPLLRAYGEGRVTGVEIVIHPHGEEPRTVQCSGTQVRDAQGALLGAVVAMADVTGQRVLEQQLRSAALHDPLTGLPNRRLLLDRLDHALRAATRDGASVTVLYGDLDGFKDVNDRHGHAVGDEVLVHAAARLTAALRPGDTVARMGGDEFVVLCPGVGDPAGVTALRERVDQAFAEPLLSSAGAHLLGMSTGHAVSRSGADAAEVVDAADRAMYEAKRLRRTGRTVPGSA